MNRWVRPVVLTSLLIATVPVDVGANTAARTRLVYAGGNSFAPYQYVDDAGVPRGFLVALLRALAREADLDVEIRLGPWRNAADPIDSGSADLVTLAISESRATRYTHVLPVWHLQQVALFRGPRKHPPRRIEDLKNEIVAVTAVSALHEDLSRLAPAVRPKLVPVSGARQALEELRTGRATMAVGNALAFRTLRDRSRIPDLREAELRSVPFCLIARRGREDLVPKFFAAYSRLQETGELTAIVERTLLAAEVERGWWEVWGAYLAGAAGLAALALCGIVGWNRSLRTQVDASTAEFRAAAERLAFHGHVLSQVTDAIVVLTHDRSVTWWNAGAEALFGVSAADAIGRPASEVLDNLAAPDDIAAIQAGVAASGAWRGETMVRRAGCEPVHVEAIVQGLLDAQGHPAGRLIVVRDIHALKLAEADRRRLERHLQQAQKLESLGVLAGGIAHDFNNLLVGMLGHAGLALAETPEGSPLRDRIQQVETCALRAAELTNQMLAYSGKGRFLVEPTDLSAVAEEMSNLLRTAITKSARLDLHLSPSLPAMSADRTQLRQIVMNLMTNASDAIGGRVGTITVTTGMMRATREYLADAYTSGPAEAGEYVFLEVRDTGCGMDAHTQQRIFDPFFTTKITGRGLGLAAVLGIVRGHRGVVRIDSAPGQGTTFRVLFPACGGVAARPSATAHRLQARKKARVLVVDDEPAVRAIARDTLVRAGFTVILAEDGPSALACINDETHTVDAVLMDMTMPGMNGIETMRAIREVVPGLPVVLTSGYSEQDAQDPCNGDTVAGFIQKPFGPSALVAKINEAVGA